MSRPQTSKAYDEVTHWHSTPLAFAILPAVGGLLFRNGSAFITDILLLVLAAVFMNWSIRLPWDWYYSAQSQRRDTDLDYDEATLVDETEDAALRSASSTESSPKPSGRTNTEPEPEVPSSYVQRREEAAAELRRQEVLALISTFVLPIGAAYLLHVIRAQLSPSSTSLVSDYNLTIFLLAAEIRPCRQLIRLATNRTLHLQRTVNDSNDPFSAAIDEKNTIKDLVSRISELEAKLSDHTILPQNVSIAQKTDISELSAEVRKRYEPRLEGLERAVRRYEKRSTTLAMLTEQRLGSLETRLQDALSLAAAAAQQSQSRGAFGKLLDSVTMLILWPLKLAYVLVLSPIHAAEELYLKVKIALLGTTSSRSTGKMTAKTRGMKDEKMNLKASGRKVVR